MHDWKRGGWTVSGEECNAAKHSGWLDGNGSGLGGWALSSLETILSRVASLWRVWCAYCSHSWGRSLPSWQLTHKQLLLFSWLVSMCLVRGHHIWSVWVVRSKMELGERWDLTYFLFEKLYAEYFWTKPFLKVITNGWLLTLVRRDNNRLVDRGWLTLSKMMITDQLRSTVNTTVVIIAFITDDKSKTNN